MAESSQTLPARFFFHKTYNDRLSQLDKVRDCIGGNEKIKDKSTLYLPQPSGMSDDAYKAYKKRALFYPVVDRTLKGAIGIMFSVPPVFDLPPELEGLKDDATTEGEPLAQAARATARECLAMGRAGLLLDLPDYDSDKPVFQLAQYRAEDVTNWRREWVNGKRQITRVVLRDWSDVDDGEDVQRFLELSLDVPRNPTSGKPLPGQDGVYKVKSWTVKISRGNQQGQSQSQPATTTASSEFSVVDQTEQVAPNVRGKTLNYIPFWFINPTSNKPDTEKSPMLDLCDANLSHYTIHADWRHALFMLAQPTPYMIGDVAEDDIPKKIGASVFWTLPEAVREVGMLEYSGVGVGSLEDALTKTEEYMAGLGAKLIHRMSQPETAESVKTKSRDNLSVIEEVIMNTGDAYNGALKAAGEWLGLKPAQVEAIKARFNNDFVEVKLDPAMLEALVRTWQAEAVSREVYHWNLQRGQIIPPDRTIEDEDESIAEAKEAKAKAEAEAKAKNPPPEPPVDPNNPDEASKGENDDTGDGGEEGDEPGEDEDGKVVYNGKRYKVVEMNPDLYHVIRKADGEVVEEHDNKADAIEAAKALDADEGDDADEGNED